MRLQLFTYFGLAALTLSLAPACNSGGQTGDLSGEHDGGPSTGEHANSGCEETRELLASFDEETEVGTANELLAYAEADFESPLVWKTAGELQTWTAGPETGEGTLHLAVTRGAKAYRLTYQPKPSQSGLAIGVVCPPAQLGVEATVSVSTEGGALAEQYDTLVRTSSAGVANLWIPLDLDELGGSLAVTFASSQSKLVQASLKATLTSAGMTGSISGIEQTNHGQVSSASSALIAVWPESAACASANLTGEGLGLAVEDEVLGKTGTATLASVASTEPVSVRWVDGSETTLTVDVVAQGDGCLSESPLPAELDGGANVVYPVQLRLQSADGRVDGEYAGSVRVSGAGDSRRVEATAFLDLAPDELDQSGFSDVELPDGSEGARVRIEVRLLGDEKAGSLQLVAYDNPPCLTNPPEPMETPGGGVAVPGCQGQTPTQLEATTW